MAKQGVVVEQQSSQDGRCKALFQGLHSILSPAIDSIHSIREEELPGQDVTSLPHSPISKLPALSQRLPISIHNDSSFYLVGSDSNRMILGCLSHWDSSLITDLPHSSSTSRFPLLPLPVPKPAFPPSSARTHQYFHNELISIGSQKVVPPL